MATKIDLKPAKTYATEANAIKAVADAFGDSPLRYIVSRDADGRFFPVFIGEEALRYGVHFRGFPVVG